jgi:hypothetical protein
MIKDNKKKYIFHLLGVSVVGFWLLMITILVRDHILSDNTSIKMNGSETIAVSSEQREWKEIFLNNRKVGYSVNMIRPLEAGYFIQEEIFLKMKLMGFEKGLYAITQSSVDGDFILKNFFFKMSSGIINYRVFGEVEDKKIVIKTGRGRRSRRRIIELKAPPMINSGIGHLFKTFEMKVGESYRLPFFDPSLMSQNEALFTITAEEKVEINRITYEAFRVETELWGNRLSFWIDRDGSVLKEEGFMGLVMIKSSAANAPRNIETGDEDDFYELSAIPVAKKIPRPDMLRSVRLRIKDAPRLDMDLTALDDGTRQTYSNGIIEIIKEEEPVNAGFTLPYNSDDKDLRQFLIPEFNIESDEEEIVDQAFDIIGDNREPVSCSGKIMEWVYRNLEKRPVVNIPSALEVIRARAGDCNEHATLLTALLRAVGVPARICVGLVYARDKFFYHAWTEAYVGEWITMDATLNQMPADVSHVRLTRGNLDKQVEIIGVIGKLELEVVDFEYD